MEILREAAAAADRSGGWLDNSDLFVDTSTPLAGPNRRETMYLPEEASTSGVAERKRVPFYLGKNTSKTSLSPSPPKESGVRRSLVDEAYNDLEEEEEEDNEGERN